jgi:uncharacterized protein YciI
MQFLLIAYDNTDPEAFNRRMKCRPEHLEKIAVIKRKGKFLCGGAILDESEKMAGSMLIYEVTSRKELDTILHDEPYIKNNVWGKIEIRPFKLAEIGK